MITISHLDEFKLNNYLYFDLKKAVRVTLRMAKIVPVSTEMTIYITNDDEIRELNRTYRHINTPTDVLSFESNQTNPETGKRFLGDIIISYPMAKQQALTAGHPVKVELLILVIHGTLHLLGFDHDTPEQKKEMWSQQEKIFAKLRLHPQQLPEN